MCFSYRTESEGFAKHAGGNWKECSGPSDRQIRLQFDVIESIY